MPPNGNKPPPYDFTNFTTATNTPKNAPPPYKNSRNSRSINAFVNNKKLIQTYCQDMNNNFLLSDVQLMLAQAGIAVPPNTKKSELCSLLTKNLPQRVLEAILIYGAQVGKGAAVSIVLALIISSIFVPGVLAPLAVETVTGFPLVYGALTGIYDGAKTVLKMDERAYKNITRNTNNNNNNNNNKYQ
jgi:hypothetical protein